jgi:L-iditol 2-dehydrogenase
MEGEYHLCLNTPYEEKGYKLIGHTVNGAYAEYQAFDAITVHPMPDSLGLEEGVSACNVGIGIEAIRRSRINIGDDVVLVGVGLLGLITMQLAKMSGAARVIAVGRGHRLKLAGELGADELVDRTQVNVVERVKELTGGVGADVVIEAAGTEDAFVNSLDCVRISGRLTAMGLFSKLVPLNIDRVVLDEIDLVGSRGAPNCLPEAIKLLESGRINVKPLVTHKLPLSEAKRGMEMFRDRLENVIRVALIP